MTIQPEIPLPGAPSDTTPRADAPFLIVGLGNPGRQYQNNRHNIGFVIVDHLARELGVVFKRLQNRALTTDARYQGHRVIMAKPQTYMNESGLAIGALARFYKIPLQNVMVAHDDVDLPFGTLRLRPGGGSAGQKGINSIIERLGSQEFPRLRFGIGRPPGRQLAAAYVLQDFDRDEMAEMPILVERAVDAVLVFVTNGLERAMNQYNAREEE